MRGENSLRIRCDFMLRVFISPLQFLGPCRPIDRDVFLVDDNDSLPIEGSATINLLTVLTHLQRCEYDAAKGVRGGS